MDYVHGRENLNFDPFLLGGRVIMRCNMVVDRLSQWFMMLTDGTNAPQEQLYY